MNEKVETAIADAKVEAGLDPEKAYPAYMWCNYLDEEYATEVWKMLLNKYIEQELAKESNND